MSTYPSQDSWIVRVQTDSYAGSFKCEMTAFCTGMTGECEVGLELAIRFDREVLGEPFEGMMLQVPDDNGRFRPCSIGSNDNSQVWMFFEFKPQPHHLDLIFNRAKVFGEENKIQVEDFELGQLTVKYFEVSHPWESDERT